MSDSELEVLQDIRTNTSNTASRLSTTNSNLNTVNANLTTVISHLVELRGQVIDVRNKVTDTKVVHLYVGDNPVNSHQENHDVITAKEFKDLYNAGWRVLAYLGGEKYEWATLMLGKYPAPNTAK